MGSLSDLNNELKQRSLTRRVREAVEAEPIFLSEQLTTFKHDPRLGRNEKLVATVKTMLQVHKNDRQEEQLKRSNPNVFGREIARSYVYGFVASFALSHDRLNWNLAEAEWAFSALEPYAVAACRNKMALAGANYVRIIDMDTGDVKSCRDPWLSQSHTVQFSADGKRLLAASAGFDAVIEFDTASGEVVWQWFAWEHGFERSKLGQYVVRSSKRHQELAAMGRQVLLVDDPAKFEFGIPTRSCPAHINSARYDAEGNILVTLFHQGAGIIIDKVTGEVRETIAGLVNPHNFSQRKSGGYFISDTRKGKLVFIDENYRCRSEIALAGSPGIERSPHLSEFLQNTTELRDGLFACIDIHRNSLWLVDVKRRTYRGIKFPMEWSMHDVASFEPKHRFRIGRLVGSAFGKVEASVQEGKMIRHFAPDGEEVAVLTLNAEGRNNELGIVM